MKRFKNDRAKCQGHAEDIGMTVPVPFLLKKEKLMCLMSSSWSVGCNLNACLLYRNWGKCRFLHGGDPCSMSRHHKDYNDTCTSN